MRAYTALLICLPLLAACADIPSTEVSESDAIEDAAYPALVPQRQILNSPAPRTSQEDLHALQVRADGIDATISEATRPNPLYFSAGRIAARQESR